jgi:hypothetical protein
LEDLCMEYFDFFPFGILCGHCFILWQFGIYIVRPFVILSTFWYLVLKKSGIPSVKSKN